MSLSTIIILVLVSIIVVAGLVLLFSRGEMRFKFDIGGSAPRAAGGNDDSGDTTIRNRIMGLGIFSGGAIAVLLARLWSMQLVSSDEYAAQAESNRTRTISIAAPRGRILDRNGKELVTNRPSLTVVADSEVENDDVEMQLLGNLLGMPRMAVKRKIEDSSEGAQSARPVMVDVSIRVVAYLEEHPDLFTGVTVQERTQRSYPYGSLAGQVLGYVGTVTSDQLAESGTSTDEGAIEYESGDTVGQAGVEYEYENVLQGVRGEQTVYVDASGSVTSYSTTVDPQAGSDVLLTLDLTIQQGCESGLAHAIKVANDLGYKDCKAGAILCMDVTNGEILGMASAPSFSPSVFVGGISNDDWNALNSEEGMYPLINRAIQGQYCSASTIKPLTSFAALSNGLATITSTYYCAGLWTGFGEAYGQYCWKKTGHGTMTIETGITYSCDVVFYEIGKAFYLSDNPEAQQDHLRMWGLGSTYDIDLPSEASGRVPDADWKNEYYSAYDENTRTWMGGDQTNLSIGQGDLLVTPLQMACAYAGIANEGPIWRPHVLKGVQAQGASGTVVEYQPEIALSPTEDATYFSTIKKGLRGVLEKESTNIIAHFSSLSVSVEGKTGTGEVNGKDPVGWFVAYAPAESPKYVCACVVEEGGYGENSAMRGVRDVFGAIYNEPDTSDASSTSGAR
ncbi:MAG: penicillin-binding protein 2 [Atopobiaceae bacterium]|nr:penicillin-binding protein 2 [Atopobiaceae bacterium]MCI1344811.1 penicillin-binding protein 2 [Atopobiaceae bacterium]